MKIHMIYNHLPSQHRFGGKAANANFSTHAVNIAQIEKDMGGRKTRSTEQGVVRLTLTPQSRLSGDF